jgi:hypothetical protein
VPTQAIDPNADWGEPYRSSPDYWVAHIAQVRWLGNASQTVKLVGLMAETQLAAPARAQLATGTISCNLELDRIGTQ